MPRSVQSVRGRPVAVSDRAMIEVAPGDADARWIAKDLRNRLARTRGLHLVVMTCPCSDKGRTAIVLKRAGDETRREAYTLDAKAGRIEIAAGATPGLFYGAATLWQMLTPDGGKGPVALPAVHIEDEPRFAWRGLMLDSARHFQSPAFVEKLIDTMALHKLNVLHWHLSDDEGWRIEIKKYPRLTEVGAWRRPAGAAGTDPATGKPRRYGGFYTQGQVREIVAYAAHRNVTIVPEIDMPGHAFSAILAYPELGSDGPPPPAIQADWGVFPWLYNVDDHTFAVLEDVLSEVMALFPSPFIHVGGDEAVKDQWKASPEVQARMKALGIKDEAALQSYFTHRISAFLVSRGRRPIGWDEILEGGDLPGGAAVMSWHGIDGAMAAAKAGHDAVLAPSPTLYFDNRQSDRPQEPPGRGAVVSLRDVYAFDPAPASLNADERRHILGLQANLWTEHVRTEPRAEAMIFPRAAAVAETGWSPASAKSWDGFGRRLPAMLARYQSLGLNADDSALAVSAAQAPGPAPDQVQVTLSTQFGLGEIHYSTNGKAPTAASPAYTAPLVLPAATPLEAAPFVDGKAASAVTGIVATAEAARRRVSQQLRLCANKLPLDLEDDAPWGRPRAVFLIDIMDPCWIYPQADLIGVSKLTVSVGQVPFNFQIGADRDKIPLHPPKTPSGELEVHLDGCSGPVIASPSLAPAAGSAGVTTLTAPIGPRQGRHDLCFLFTSRGIDPMWAISWVQLDLAQPVGKGGP
jgi:hexosaminidase